MQLIDAFVRNPVKVAVGVLADRAVRHHRTDADADAADARGADTHDHDPDQVARRESQEVEQEIVIEQEEQLKSVEGINKMTSESADSAGTITLEFQVGTNMDEALLKVNSRLQQVREYPEDADQPVISTANASDRPIAWFILSARRPSEADLDAFEQRHPDLAEKLRAVRQAHNVGVAMLRLRLLAKEHPEFDGTSATRRPGCHQTAPLCRGRDRSTHRTRPGRIAIQCDRRFGGRTAGDRRSGAAGGTPTDA